MTRGGIPEPERPDANIVVDRFRKELNTDYLDLVQIHCMMSGSWTDEQKKQMDILDNLKVKGIIRAHGVSVHSLQALEAASASPWVDVIHVRINPFGASMDSNDPAQIVPVIKKMHDSGKGIIGMKLIGNGSFSNDSDKVDQSIKYVLGLGTVDMVIIGFEKPEQIDDYVVRMEKVLNPAGKRINNNICEMNKLLVCSCLFLLLNHQLLSQEDNLKYILKPGAKLEKLAGGFSFTEGPTADKKGNVYFTDQPNDRIFLWNEKTLLSSFMEPASRSNGLALDAEGNIWSCADEKNELLRISPDKKIEVIAGGFNGKLFNGPNDLWITPAGGVYFTDPFYSRDMVEPHGNATGKTACLLPET